MNRPIPNTNEIGAYLHCSMCIREAAHPQMIAVGWTPLGIQVWCERHKVNVVHIDFEKRQHPANSTAQLPVSEAEEPPPGLLQ